MNITLEDAASNYANLLVEFYRAREQKQSDTQHDADEFDRIQSDLLEAESMLHSSAIETAKG